MPPPHRFFFNTIRFYVFFWHYPAWQCFVWEKLKKDPRVWCSPRCKDGQNCHCGRLSFHFPDIRSRWRLWRLKADHCALLSKRPIIILAIFRPHQWLINCVQFSFPQKISCFFFFIERLSWWMDSQFCQFLRRGFFCRISDEVCLVINTALVKFSSQIFVGPRLDRGGGGYWQDLSKFLQHNNPRILLSSEIVWE